MVKGWLVQQHCWQFLFGSCLFGHGFGLGGFHLFGWFGKCTLTITKVDGLASRSFAVATLGSGLVAFIRQVVVSDLLDQFRSHLIHAFLGGVNANHMVVVRL